jgi:hypothetical protein
MTPQPRGAGQYDRDRTRLLALRVLVGILTVVAVGVPVGMVAGFTSLMLVVAEVAAIGGMLLQDRLAMLFINGWACVGDDEKHLRAAGHGARPTQPSSDWSIVERPA